MSEHLIPLLFEEEHLVRTVVTEEEGRFVGVDVCQILELAKPHQAMDRLDDDERGTCIVGTPGGPQEMVVITEAGVYRLVFTGAGRRGHGRPSVPARHAAGLAVRRPTGLPRPPRVPGCITFSTPVRCPGSRASTESRGDDPDRPVPSRLPRNRRRNENLIRGRASIESLTQVTADLRQVDDQHSLDPF